VKAASTSEQRDLAEAEVELELLADVDEPASRDRLVAELAI